MTTLFILLCAHFVADYPLQSHQVAIYKSRHMKDALSAAVPWYYWMTGHAAMQALDVFVVTRSLGCAVVELAAHWLIDAGKCERWYSIHVDQALHIACKVAYVAAIGLVTG